MTPRISVVVPVYNEGEEINAFLECVRTGATPPIDAEAGFAAVRTAQRIIEAVRRDW